MNASPRTDEGLMSIQGDLEDGDESSGRPPDLFDANTKTTSQQISQD
jgi:hypothetical protein